MLLPVETEGAQAGGSAGALAAALGLGAADLGLGADGGLSTAQRARAAGRGKQLEGSFRGSQLFEGLEMEEEMDELSLGGRGRGRDRADIAGELGGGKGGKGGRKGGGKGGGKGFGMKGGGGGKGGRGGRGRGGRGGPVEDEMDKPAVFLGRGGWGVGSSEVQQGRPRRRRPSPGSGYDGRGGGEEGEGSGTLYEGDELDLYSSIGGAEEEDANDPFMGLNMREVYGNVQEAQMVFPMKKPRPKGLARILQPELADAPPEYDHSYPWGLQPFDFEPDDVGDDRPGHYRYSAVDRLLSTHEEEAELCLQPLGDLSSVEDWFDALQLPADARMRRNPRFVRVLELFSDGVKFTPEEKDKMLSSLKFGMAADPKAAGYTDGVLPFDVPGYDESEMEPWLNFGVKGAKRPEPKVPINGAYRQAE